MKSLILPAAVVAFILSACGKEPAPPSKPPAAPSSQAAPAPGGTLTMEEKQKAMEDAKAAAKAGGRKGE
jgi:hypothetical protein